MATTFKWFGLVAATLALVGCSADATDNGEQVGESEDHLLAGRRVTPSEIASLLRQAGFPSSAIGKMVCTAKYESNFYERASNHNRNGTTDYGLFQINSVHFGDRGCPSSSAALYNASTNVRCAKAVYDSQGIGAWYGYKKHKSECDRYAAPAGSTAPTAPSNSSSSGSGSSSGGSSGSTDPIGADDPTDGSDLGASSSSGGSDPATPDDVGGCWSATLQDMVDANTCVQSASNGIWYQCHEGQWYRGVSGSDGPYGACTSVHSL